ncbi:DoxX family protein [Flavobacterium sp. ACAM 123]|uniref:DoxX family protein n=1 Tax=Flavobacterium sp. ACAM 123 TaxID=1189620 RepID=UPI0002E8E3D3|nr:DoxX family protein [Flavobacterium sp. ACAM 123]
MKLSAPIKKGILEVVCLLYMLLLIYAAVSKLLDFENFQVQLGQSPLLSAFAGWVSWGVPIVELVIALLLLVPRFRLVGLFAAFSLLVMFTTYIIIILNFSSFIPCSCGGILEKMGWTEHLLFNIGFLVLALIGIRLITPSKTVENTVKIKRFFITVLGFFVCSIGVVILLFVLSEDIVHHRNNFVRRFPHHPVIKTHEMDIKFNSYYIAGIDNGKIYLGNVSAPLNILVIDTALQFQERFIIQLSKEVLPFLRVQVRVKPPYFYVVDGTIPIIFKGNINDWKASVLMYGKVYFSLIEPTDAKNFAFRAVSSTKHRNVLGTLKINGTTEVKLADNLLKKQIDGLFDTDGMLLFNEQLQKVIYTYYYRNQYLITDSHLNLDYVGHTIDTTSRARIKVAYINSKKQYKLSAPPLLVNKSTSTYGNYLFVNAGLMGQYEPEEMWRKASVIDVYDFLHKRYDFSFYIEDQEGHRLEHFEVKDNLVVALMGHKIITYRLQTKGFAPSNFKLYKGLSDSKKE